MTGNLKSMGVAYRDQLVAGTTTNDNALAGDVGEFVTSSIPSGSAVALTTATPANVTSISLTPGDWDIDGQLNFSPAAATSVTQINGSISLTSATLAGQTGGSGLGTDPTATFTQAAAVPNGLLGLDCGTVRLSIAVQTTVYFVAQSTFTVSTMSAYGTIRARRIR